MQQLATALEDAGGTAAPRERVAQLRTLLREELARSEHELTLARSGREQPVVVVFAARDDALVAVAPVAATLRADPDAVSERAWLLAAATIGALVEIAQPPPPRGRDDLLLEAGALDGSPRAAAADARPGGRRARRRRVRGARRERRAPARRGARAAARRPGRRGRLAPRADRAVAAQRGGRSRGSAAAPPTPRRSPSTRTARCACSRRTTARRPARTTTRSPPGGSRAGSCSA